jgi:hypothetical protein
LEENSQRQILRLNVKTIRGKLKVPHTNVSVRLFSGLNFIRSEQSAESATNLLLTVQGYLYLECRESRCSLAVYSGEEVVGVGALELNIVGFFERRVGVVCPHTRKELGYLMVAVQSEKHPARSIQLAQLTLHLGRLQIQRPAFLSFTVTGCYTRTELQDPHGPTLAFRRLILMKYTTEQHLEIALTDGTQDILRTVVSIEELKSCGDPIACMKVLQLNEGLGCTLEMTCIYGDLNKINPREVLPPQPVKPKPVPPMGI